jgi:hypothetical protein
MAKRFALLSAAVFWLTVDCVSAFGLGSSEVTPLPIPAKDRHVGPLPDRVDLKCDFLQGSSIDWAKDPPERPSVGSFSLKLAASRSEIDGTFTNEGAYASIGEVAFVMEYASSLSFVGRIAVGVPDVRDPWMLTLFTRDPLLMNGAIAYRAVLSDHDSGDNVPHLPTPSQLYGACVSQ